MWKFLLTHRHRSLGNLNDVNKEYKRLATIRVPINLSDELREIMKRDHEKIIVLFKKRN